VPFVPRLVGAFEPAVFGRRQPRDLQTWHCTATRERVEVLRRDYFHRSSFSFERGRFLVRGKLPAPALGGHAAQASPRSSVAGARACPDP
jgi:hypothetical protein